jgi:hypothetical protein
MAGMEIIRTERRRGDFRTQTGMLSEYGLPIARNKAHTSPPEKHTGLSLGRSPVPKRKETASEDCEAWLTIGHETYQGATGKGAGHAEMHALHKMVEEDDGLDFASRVANVVAQITVAKKKTVFCPSRDVCIQCGYVLQGMSFNVGKGTDWGKTTMGKTEWGVSMNVKALLEAMGVDYATALAFRR